MNDSSEPDEFAVAPLWRAGLVALALVSGTLLLAAARLDADPRGFGTHEQLGLYPCSIMTLCGFRCPACGMTTAWTLLLHGDLLGSARANFGGLLLGIAAIVTVPWALWSAATGKWLALRPGDWTLALGLAAIVAITLAEWAWRLM